MEENNNGKKAAADLCSTELMNAGAVEQLIVKWKNGELTEADVIKGVSFLDDLHKKRISSTLSLLPETENLKRS